MVDTYLISYRSLRKVIKAYNSQFQISEYTLKILREKIEKEIIILLEEFIYDTLPKKKYKKNRGKLRRRKLYVDDFTANPKFIFSFTEKEKEFISNINTSFKIYKIPIRLLREKIQIAKNARNTYCYFIRSLLYLKLKKIFDTFPKNKEGKILKTVIHIEDILDPPSLY